MDRNHRWKLGAALFIVMSVLLSIGIVRALHTTGQKPGPRHVSYRTPAHHERSDSRPVSGPHKIVDLEDDEIRRGVSRALVDLDATDNANISVAVTDGIVRLTGSVPSWQGNSSRLSATRSVTGVRSILNEIAVDAPKGERR